MRKAAALFLTFILFVSFTPVTGTDASNVRRGRAGAPNFEIRTNRLFLDGAPIDTETVFNRFEFLLVRSGDYNTSILSQLDVDDIRNVPVPNALSIVPDTGDILNGSAVRATGTRIRLELGDALYGRTRAAFTPRGGASEWRELRLDPSMFAPSTASNQNDLPDLAVTQGSLTAALKSANNTHTRFEYAIIPQTQPAGFSPKWIPIGSAADRGGEALTARFLPSGSPYAVCLRIEGDDKDGFLFARADGITMNEPDVLLSHEKIGPLSGGGDGSVWHFTSDGGKTWRTVNVSRGEESFIDLIPVYGKKEVDFQLKRGGNGGGIDTQPTVLEGTLQPRPAFPKGVGILAFVSSRYPENWTMQGNTDPLEYSTDGNVWQPLIPDVGLPLLNARQQAAKVKATPYFIRTAPNESAGEPASFPKKFNQPKQTKTPTAKPDYKRETINLKAGMMYSFGGENASMEGMVFQEAAGLPVDIEDAISGGLTVYIYSPEGGKRSRSSIQKMSLAERGETPDEGQGLVLSKNSARLEKGFEYFGSKDKWGSFTKGDTQGMIRRKATAKFNAKTGTNRGLAASGTVMADVEYDGDGKRVVSVAVERKQAIPLLNWNLSWLTGGTAAYDSFDDNVQESFIVVGAAGETVSFTISPELSPENQALASSMTVALNNAAPAAVDGAYSFRDLKEGDVVFLSIIPKNSNAYRKATATITIVPPHEEGPRSVAFGPFGDFGTVTVILSQPVPLGQTRTMHVDLVRLPEGRTVYKQTTDIDYVPVFNSTTDRVTLDFKKALSDAGPGEYELRAYFKGTSRTSDSIPVKAAMTFVIEDFGIRSISVSAPASLTVGSKVDINWMRDAFGNDLQGSAYQWYFISSGGTPRVIEVNGNSSGYTITASDAVNFRGHSMEVLIYANEQYYPHTVTSRVP
jgi:hypothetical protein